MVEFASNWEKWIEGLGTARCFLDANSCIDRLTLSEVADHFNGPEAMPVLES